MNRFFAALVFAAFLFAASDGYAASTINPNVPSPNSTLSSGPVRQNFTAAYNDISNILGMYAGTSAPLNPTNGQDWINTTSMTAAVWSKYDATTNTWIAIGTFNFTAGTFAFSASTITSSCLANVPLVGNGNGSLIQCWATGALGTTAHLNVGTSVANPGTGTAEALLPIQTTTGASKTFGTSDLFQETRRSNAAAAMTDTFPASSATGLVNGTRITVSNVDASASDTITAGSGTTISSNNGCTNVVGPGRSISYSYDAPNTVWRCVFDTASALLSINNLSDLGSAATARTNLGLGALATLNVGTGLASSGGNLNCSAATNIALGCVSVDGTIITVSGGAITVAKASSTAFGVVEVDNTTIKSTAGVIAAQPTTINGTACTPGGSCTVSATATSITSGTTTVGGGATNQLLYDNAGVLGEITKCNQGVYATSSTGVPGCNLPTNGLDVTTAGLVELTAARRTLPTTSIVDSSSHSGGFGANGSGTYTTPANVLWVEFFLIGGGGGGAGSGTSPGAATAGGNTCLNTSGAACTTPVYQAGGGGAGLSSGGSSSGGAISGSGTCSALGSAGGNGGAGSTSTTDIRGGAGGGAPGYGSGGPGGVFGNPGASGSGNGGGGGGGGETTTANGGGGGGGGAVCRVIINNPAASYTFAVGANGAAGTAGTGGSAGGTGTGGIILAIEHYGS